MSTINLLLNHYIGDDFNPSRQVSFFITEECLRAYLKKTEDERTIEHTYDSDEAKTVYEYSVDDNRIISERITYCSTFMSDYKDFIKRNQIFNPGMKPETISTKEDYYWNVFVE